ncbi:MAG: SDR family NAD(P)-dependent oxidoreductase, partial [Actinomycetota bacterium]|nr:SDR family NAD(P)-dependent oxidoreductase [Actinomycetota bacterium]
MDQGQNYVIVGAGGGIGAACAERLAADSRAVVCMDLDPVALEETTRRLLRVTGAEVADVEIDVRDEGRCA